ncbi:MAG: Cell shape determining protein, MreB/Mrl family [Parcubacteria group bacterium GW2011_GWA2_43_17]|nr:MAG: Cell shape determining protein, MreB/Mrl family [Parcubacteria group bacterium GW2011_GWA2_43_17]KKT92340.1 MAG: Cell shape determining protein, MreB/Mrl family [Parcubacteria group bacterium GW2011_GWF2_45_11]KKT97331.1 MAG: Cell shape determining protein, MreB/Mrl family [Parcubacteria group bacterium GW2011_GWC2_45_15]OGY92992.1 MAG: rod shape-determining protein [Candidatus Komeilibacteria bacterium RIFOXYA2_FULL_45_9]OGY96245.1 MAG: rod shape-determining protein [Candidatus Komeili
MFNKILGKFSADMGIDLGTANTRVYVKDKGFIINEPSVVAINNRNDQIIAIGEEANKMVGKTPGHITISKPLVNGVISDFEVTEKMIKHFINKVHKEHFSLLPRPRVVVGIPLDVTEVERKAVEDACKSGGAREVYLVEQPIAAAIGARLPIQEASGTLIVETGAGTTEIAVISLGGVVTFTTLPIAGNELNENIIHYARENFSLLLGEKSAENLKIKIATVASDFEKEETTMRGRDLMTGLPKEYTISNQQIREAIIRSVRQIVEAIRNTIEKTPPELVVDIYERGILLSGGTALLKGLDKIIGAEIKIPIHVIDDPLTSVVRGTGIILEDLDNLKDVLLPATSD